MSYDLYCYRPSSPSPSVEEGRAIIETEIEKPHRNDQETQAITRKIANAIVEFNPRLEEFRPDFEEIAKFQKTTAEEVKADWSHIELNPPEGDLAIQLTVYWDHVDLNTPYWYKDGDAAKVFEQMNVYVRVIRQTAGFFVYDPQDDRAFDPEKEEIGGHANYEKITKDMPNLVAKHILKNEKPWWKFW